MLQNNQDMLMLECGADAFAGLHSDFQKALRTAAEQYASAVPDASPWVVTSALRSLKRQAELMAEMTQEQLLAMYCSGGTPTYIQEICRAWPADAETIHRILANRTEGYISKHLYGLAADIDASSVADPDLFRKIILENGAQAVLDERAMGIPCLHVSWKRHSVP
ncbi:MAG: hypothetical protein J6S21_04960 [Victivallales bacterium]|nr:hypothetical protein [Victivallales bacterium]